MLERTDTQELWSERAELQAYGVPATVTRRFLSLTSKDTGPSTTTRRRWFPSCGIPSEAWNPANRLIDFKISRSALNDNPAPNLIVEIVLL
jgi:hypothetical protein